MLATEGAGSWDQSRSREGNQYSSGDLQGTGMGEECRAREIREVDGKAGEYSHGNLKGTCPMQEVPGEDAEDRQSPPN